MKKISLIQKLKKYENEYQKISKSIINDGNKIYSNKEKYKKFIKKYTKLEKTVHLYQKYKKELNLLKEANFIMKNDKDLEIKELAFKERSNILKNIYDIEKKIENILFLSSEEHIMEEDDRNAIMELRSGTGGNEACLFVEDILRMYTMYFKKSGLKYKILHAQKGGINGYKEIILDISGKKGIYGDLKFESGVHRVQRIPKTESQGRVHTSAITVAVLPQVEEIEVKINLTDLKKDTFRSSGSGGQHVNKTESAVRLTHIPSKITVECQEERSQHKNFEKAMNVLRSRIYHRKMEDRLKKRSIQRKSLVSTGDRSVKIRTYNYPNNRVTDHRIHKSIHDLTNFMNGDIQEMINSLKVFEENQNK
ncbi:peptide chain release factor 1 [Blattabacterium cuenoti]|uniref:peptide chain release factor 1 n=1 Tax=Blattabacterium cuenoti TaxID=1653831 RepID=UPI00163C9B0F|nr:peptide chain release factor 1 [Blattabacterium cuenoti]